MNYINWASIPKIDNRLVWLYETLKEIKKPEILISLEDYICFPLIQIINDKNTSQQNIEMIIKCLTYIIENVKGILSVNLFQNFLVASSKQASQENVSEELKYSAVHCILALIKSYPNREELFLKTESSFKKKVIINRNDLNNKIYKMAIAHVISICLDLAEKEKLLILRLEALEVLRCLVDILEYSVIVKFVPGIVSSLLKTCINSATDNHRVLVNSLIVLEEIICKAFNDKVNAKFLKSNAVVSWNNLKNIYTEKNNGKTPDKSITKKPEKEEGVDEDKNKSKKDTPKNKIEEMFDEQDKAMESEVTEEWLNMSSVKILNLLTALNKVRGHSHQNVRKQFILFAKNILCNCKETLQICLNNLVEVLVNYLNDDVEEVSTLCFESIHEVAEKFKDNEQFQELLKKNFEKLILSFPRLLTTSNDTTKLDMINQADGYLILLGDEATVLIQTSIELIINSLIEILTFDVSDIRLIEDRYNYNNNQIDIIEASKTTTFKPTDLFILDDQNNDSSDQKTTDPTFLKSTFLYTNQYSKYFPKKNFKYIHDDKVTKVLSQLCHLIGYYGDISFLVDYLLNTYIINNNYTDNTITPIYLLNEICMGGYHRLKDSQKEDGTSNPIIKDKMKLYYNLLENILFEYSHSKILDMPTSLMDEELLNDFNINKIQNIQDPLKENKIESFNEVILKICLILEGISTISLIMRDDFKVHLMETLYILLEKLGDNNRTISDLAMSCLNLVSQACGYSDASELILDNVDYIINIVTQKLRYIEYNIKAPRVLKAAIEVSEYPIIQYMNDTIEELCEILDQNKNNASLGGLVIDVFQALMNVLNQYSINENEKKSLEVNANAKESPSEGNNDKEKREEKEEETKKESTPTTNSDKSKKKASPHDALVEQMVKSAIFQKADPEIQVFFLKNVKLSDSDSDSDEDDKTEKEEKTNSGEKSNINKIEDYFKNYHKKKEEKDKFENEHALEEEGEGGDGAYDHGDSLEEDKDEETVKMSYDQKLCLRVVKETSYYIHSDSPELRSKSLRVIKASFQMLGYYPKELYPMVHQLWPTLLKRLNDPAQHVIKDTIQLINEMITTTSIGADFLNRAVADELLPILFHYMEEYNEKIMPVEVFKKSPNSKRKKDFERVKYQKGNVNKK